MITIRKLERAENTLFESVRDLLAELYPKNPLLKFTAFQQVVEGKGDCVSVFAAFHGGKVVGIASLASYKKLLGRIFEIEDVVVKSGFRDRQIGSALVSHLVGEAMELGADFIDVNTRDEKGLNFYRKLGFVEQGKDRPFFYLRRTLRQRNIKQEAV